MQIECFAICDLGHGRSENQDKAGIYENRGRHIIVDDRMNHPADEHPPVCIAVADGMGELDDGAIASAAALDGLSMQIENGLHRSPTLETVKQAAGEINQQVVRQMQDGEVMGTTLTAVLLPEDEGTEAFLLHAGDSRALLFRPENGEITQISSDQHSTDPAENEKTLANFFGSPFPKGHEFAFQDHGCRALSLPRECTLLLHTDGMDQPADDLQTLLETQAPLSEIGDTLVERSRKTSRDNITVVLWRRGENA